MSYKQTYTERIHESIQLKQAILHDEPLLDTIDNVVEASVQTLQQDGKILFCGNGGSASDAQHLAAELTGRFYLDRKPLDAEALHVNTSALTAGANDYGYDETLARVLEAKGRKGDILFALSTSGSSQSILNALHKANDLKMTTVGLTGNEEAAMDALCGYILKVPSTKTPRIQECHIMLGHLICECIEKHMFAESPYS